jgi:hypothetical protein
VELEKQKAKMHLVVNKMASMKEDLGRYFIRFLSLTGIELVSKGMEIDGHKLGMKGEVIPFDIKILESLKKKYQQLESRQEKLKVSWLKCKYIVILPNYS